MKKLSLMLAALLSVLLLSAAGTAGHPPYAVDDAGLFTGTQLEDLETQAAALSASLGLDVVIVTTDDTGGRSSMEYADDYFDYNGYGQGSDNDGILMLIDMDNREVWLSTTGLAIRYYTDARIESILDDILVYMPNGDYYNAALAFLKSAEYWHAQGIPEGQHNIDEDGNVDYYQPPRAITPEEAFLAGGAALLSGGAFFGITLYRYRVGAKKSGFNAAENTRYKLTDRQDVFVNRTMTQRHIPRDSGGGGGFSGGGGGSSTHTSSSGTSHGGGGRSF